MRGETAPSVANRGAMTATIICACVMQGADTTIANVCKPAHPRQHVGIAGSDLVGADILHRLFGDRSQTRHRFVDDSALEEGVKDGRLGRQRQEIRLMHQ